jgi:regulator of sigma E protease
LITTILSFLCILALLVVIHELGHFLTAKLFGVKVLEFGIGYPPRIMSFTRNSTIYSLNIFPLGGFVKLLGEEDPSDPQSLARQNRLVRLTILASGAIMNFLLAWLLFTVLYAIPQERVSGNIQIMNTAENSPAKLAGLKPGDLIIKIDDQIISTIQDATQRIRMRLGENTTWTIIRPQKLITGSIGSVQESTVSESSIATGKKFSVTLIPRWNPPEGEGHAGIIISNVNVTSIRKAEVNIYAISNGFQIMVNNLLLIKKEISGWILTSTTPQFAGPIGIAQVTGEVARSGLIPLINLSALLSLQLAILNLLPIPALDGGRIMFLGIETLRRGKRISPEKEAFVHLTGIILLLSLIAVISYFDISRILSGESLLK